jgi:hypothetical protein
VPAASLSKADARKYAVWLGYARIGLGVAAFVAPVVPSRPWVGAAEADRPGARVFARALGGRDLALGLGVVLAARHDGPVRGWVEGGGMADAGDLVATLLAWRSLPRLGRLGILAVTAGAVAAARVIAPAVD